MAKLCLPKGFITAYLGVFVLAVVALYLTGRNVAALTVAGIGFCLFVLADTLQSLRYAPPATRRRKILAVFICVFTACSTVLLVVVLFRYSLAI